MDNNNYIKGRNTVIEALTSGREIKEIIFAKNIKEGKSTSQIKELAQKRKIKCSFEEQEKIFQRAGNNHQGVIALVESFNYFSLEDLLKRSSHIDSPIVLILDNIQDPRNFGSIIRTAETAGVTGIIIPERRSARVNSTVEKTSSGALAYMPVVMVVNINNTISKLKDHGFWVYGLSPVGENDYTGADFKGPVCFVLGSEGEGLRPLIEKNCDFLIKIPMKGKINSLNVSVACGIVLYEALRQRTANSER